MAKDSESVLARVRAEQDRLRKKLRDLDTVAQYLESSASAETSSVDTDFDAEVTGTGIGKASFAGVTAPRAAAAVLRDRGKPMHLRDIVRGLLKRGYDGQTNPTRLYANLYSALARRNKNLFYRVPNKPATFALVEWKTKVPDEAATPSGA